MAKKIISFTLIVFLCTGCFQCKTYYETTNLSDKDSVDMYISTFDSFDNYDLQFCYEITDRNTLIEDVAVVFLDKNNDTINYKYYFSYLAGDSSGIVNEFKEIDRRYRVPKYDVNLTRYMLNSGIKENEFTMIVKTKIKQNDDTLMFENKYKVIGERD